MRECTEGAIAPTRECERCWEFLNLDSTMHHLFPGKRSSMLRPDDRYFVSLS